MALDSSLVRVAVTGAAYVAATGSTAPTDAAVALDAAFKELGYYSEDGVTEARDRTTNDIRGHNGDTVRTVVTESTATFALTFIETNQRTIEAFYGGSVVAGTPPASSIVVVPSTTGGRKAFVLDVIDGSDLRRIYIPAGEITEVGEVVYSNGEPVGYPVTISAYPDDAISGSYQVFISDLTA